MYEYMEIGPVPADENCAQLGTDDYRENASKEMNAYINQLERVFSEHIANGEVFFRKKWFAHDFGSYGEVVVCYNPDNTNSCNAAFEIEGNLPSNWDDEAIKELEMSNDSM